jgi:hypothetical protein
MESQGSVVTKIKNHVTNGGPSLFQGHNLLDSHPFNRR